MNLNLDEEKCIGCGSCVASEPDYFEFNDNGLVSTVKSELTEEEKNQLEYIVGVCPTNAISIN